MPTGYFDDSGTHLESDVAVVGGLLGPADVWNALAPAWSEVLRSQPKPITKGFRSAELRERKGEFRKYTQSDEDRLLNELTGLLIDPKHRYLFVMASATDMREVHRLFACHEPQDRRILGYLLPFADCIELTAKTGYAWSDYGPLVYIFDNQGNIEEQARVVYEGVRKLVTKKSVWLAENMAHTVVFSYATETQSKPVPLQAADMVAYETHRHLKKHLYRPDHRDRRVLNELRGMPIVMRLWDRQKLESVARVAKGEPVVDKDFRWFADVFRRPPDPKV